jgi:hypothetical protein
MRFFCTYFDRNYLLRGLALYRSLQRHCGSFELWVLCMDTVAYDVLTELRLPGLFPISLAEFEAHDDGLKRVKTTRSTIEYYFTCSPSLPLFVLHHNPHIDLVTYLDADLFFFADPAPLYREIGEASIAIIGHRFAPHMTEWERYGIYNVGWLTFRRDQHGLECLQWWRERCLEWCYDRLDEGRFADQKYLDDWPRRFHSVRVLQHKGANLAPWNLTNYEIACSSGNVLVDTDPLIFFHFHRLKQLEGWAYDPNLSGYRSKASNVIRRQIYAPYIRTLEEVLDLLPSSIQGDCLRGNTRDGVVGGNLSNRLFGRLLTIARLMRGIARQDYILVLNHRVL